MNHLNNFPELIFLKKIRQKKNNNNNNWAKKLEAAPLFDTEFSLRI